MTNEKKGSDNLEKEELLLAVVIVDDFDGIFADYTEKGSPALLPVANSYAVDYALEYLGRCGFEETILYCTSHAQVLEDHLRNSPWSQPASTMKIKLLVSENCRSLGDVLRDIDNKAIIKGDFVLMSSFTVTNVNLLSILKKHRQLRLKDKGAAMTLVLQDVGSRNPKWDNSAYVMNAVTNKLLQVTSLSPIEKFSVPVDHVMENDNISILSNLVDTGVTICSQSVPVLFSDNFDSLTKGEFIQGILENYDMFDIRIYCHLVENGYCATIKNWNSYRRVNLDCIRRWTFPLVPDQSFTGDEAFSFCRNCVYKQPEVQLVQSVELKMDVVIGASTKIGQNTSVTRSVIGKNCTLGQNLVLRDSVVFDNAVIEDNCKVEYCIVGEKSRINENSKLLCCYLKRRVVIEPKTRLKGAVVVNEPLGEDWKKRGDAAYSKKIYDGYWSDSDDDLTPPPFKPFIDFEAKYPGGEEEEEDSSSVSDGEKSHSGSPEPDDNQLFYNEVVDSLLRGFGEKLLCENLILEINSSRYAYNVSLSDVTVLTLKGILLLGPRANASPRELLGYFLPLLRNYIKTSQSQMECLRLMEEICGELGNEVAKCIHFMYDKEILSEESILQWHQDLDGDSPVLSKVAPLVKWLKEAPEESSSEEPD